MSRISYSEDESFPGQFALWRSNLNRSIASKRGQESLRDLREALLGLPQKRLISHHLAKDGDVCTTGALVLYRRIKGGEDYDAALGAMVAEAQFCTCWHGRTQHVEDGHCNACEKHIKWAINYRAEHPDSRGRVYEDEERQCEQFVEDERFEDDEDEQGETEGAAVNVGVPKMVAWRLVELNDMELDRETPEERYEKVLKWVESRLNGRLDPVW
jgi:hypothetical protein